MELTAATWTEVRDLDTDLALLVTGSLEQHGPHAPLGTDRLTAGAVAESAADAVSAGVLESVGEVALAPAIPVGISEEHRGFAGSLWVSPDTFRAYVSETIESLRAQGFSRVVVVNGHGGNSNALAELCAGLTRHEDCLAVPFTWFEAIESDRMGHAGPVETALLRAIDPELVREGRIEAARENASEQWGEWVSGTDLAVDSAEFTENGVVGDPGGPDTDAAAGEELLEDATAALLTLIEAVAERDLD